MDWKRYRISPRGFRDTFQKNTVAVCPVTHFPIHTINLTDLKCQSLVTSAFQKLLCHKWKLRLNLKKPKYFPCRAHAAYQDNSKFKMIILILCLIHTRFVLWSSQYCSWAFFPTSHEVSTDLQVGVWTLLIFNPCFNCGVTLSSNLTNTKVIPVCKKFWLISSRFSKASVILSFFILLRFRNPICF